VRTDTVQHIQVLRARGQAHTDEAEIGGKGRLGRVAVAVYNARRLYKLRNAVHM
jgi:hypothetical protein